MVESGCQMPANITGANSSCTNQSYPYSFASIVDFQFYAWGVAGNIIAALGVIGNTLSIFVLANRRLRSSTSVYLIALSIFDSLVLISLALFMALPVIYYATGALQTYHAAYPYLQPFAYPLALTAQTCSIYITVGFTTERFIAVCYPLRATKWCSVERARKTVAIIILASVIYNIPRWLEYHTVLQFNPHANKTYAIFTYTRLGENSTFRYIYFIFMHMFVMLLIPFVVLSVLNTMLIRAVRQSAKVEGKVTNKQRRENNLTAMLIAVIVVFLICQVPSIVDNACAAAIGEDTLGTLPFVKLSVISSLMVILNSAINFYLYCVFGQKFRGVFCRIFCQVCQKHNPDNRNTSLMNQSRQNSRTKQDKFKELNATRQPIRQTNFFQKCHFSKNHPNGHPTSLPMENDTKANKSLSPLLTEESRHETQL